MAPVTNLLTISEAGSTSDMSKGFLANLICNCPRSVQERTYNRMLLRNEQNVYELTGI